MSLRVAMVGACPYPVPQGSQTLLRDTALALSQRGHTIHLVVYGYGTGTDTSGLPLHRCIQIPGARRTAAGPSWAKPLLDLALARKLQRVIRDEQIELVHAHNYEGLLVAIATRRQPIVYHAHNALSDELPYYFRGASWAEKLGAYMDKTLPRLADHVIAPHRRLADYLVASGCVRERVTVIPPFLAPWPLDSTVQTLETPPVVYAGNLDAYQNLPFLLRVMDKVREAEPRAQLNIVTADRRPISGAESVYAPDYDTMRAALAPDCVFVCPRVSWSGFPIKLLNAMAAAKPIVACASSAHPLEQGISGLVVPDNDETAFAACIVRLLRNPEERHRLGTSARATLEQFHSPAAAAQRIEDIYQRLLENPITRGAQPSVK